MSLGSRIKEERGRLDLTQPQFAKVAGSSTRSVASWEADEVQPTASVLRNLAIAGIDIAYVLTGERNIGRLDGAARQLADSGLRLGENGEVVPASEEYVTGAFLAGRDPEQVRLFTQEADQLGFELQPITRARALYLIDQYGVRSHEVIDFIYRLTNDFACDVAKRNSNDTLAN